MHWIQGESPCRAHASTLHDISARRGTSEGKTVRGGEPAGWIPEKIKLTEVMHTEFSWIAFCLPRGLFSSWNRRRYEPRYRKCGAETTNRAEEEGRCVCVYRKEAAKRDTTYRESSEKARATGGFLFQFTAPMYHSKILGRRCVRGSHCNHAIRAHGKPHVVGNMPSNSSRGSVESFSSGPKRFLHICNGSSNLCAFTEARPSTGTGISIVVSFSCWIRPHRSTDSVVSAIAFRNLFSTRECAKPGASNDHRIWASETQREKTPYSIVRN